MIAREVWRGELWAVRPMRVVADDDHLALWRVADRVTLDRARQVVR